MSESTTPPTRSQPHSDGGMSPAGALSQGSTEKWMGPYRLDKKIGEGAMGIVYRAHDSVRDRDVALKTLQRIDPVSLSHLKSEFRSLVHLSHENLVTLYELRLEGDYWCLIMELVDGIPFITHITGSPDKRDEGRD